MAEEDNFDIDIYGDDNAPENKQSVEAEPKPVNGQNGANGEVEGEGTPGAMEYSTSQTGQQASFDHGGQPPQQGVKRKNTSDDRPIDSNATNSVQITDLHWWITEDDVRGWCARAGSEGELKDITFNEHKVNGKSKGQVYVEFASQGASASLKHYLDRIDGKDPKKPSASYFHGPHNPYKTLPKDNARTRENRSEGRSFNNNSTSNNNNNTNTNSNFSGNNNFNSGGSFRGGRGGNFNSNRGGSGGMNMGGFNRGGFQGNQMGNQMGNMAGNMGMNPYGNMNQGGFNNNFNRGGMMGGNMRGGMQNRGGRGGMGGNPAMGMPMAGMGMGMPGMGMPNMMGNPMGGGFQAQPHFNPGFFQGQNAGGDNHWGNPHGAKRSRPNE